jgi:hypothetical protein
VTNYRRSRSRDVQTVYCTGSSVPARFQGNKRQCQLVSGRFIVVENDMEERRKHASAIVGQSDNELVPCYVITTEFIIAACGSLYEKASAGPWRRDGQRSARRLRIVHFFHQNIIVCPPGSALRSVDSADSGAMIQIVIRPKPSYNIPPCTAMLRFQNPPRRQACRPSRRRVHPFRAGHQPEGGKGAHPQHPN